MDFKQINSEIKGQDQQAMDEARKHWDNVAKPLGSLGRLETNVTKLAGLTGGDLDISKRAVVVMCADNGVLEEGVAMTPVEVTAMMTSFIAAGRSSVCAMAKQAGADVFTVDVGVASKVDAPNLIDKNVMRGTHNMAKGPAMSREEAQQAIQVGMDMVKELKDKGYKLLATGEMGIGNTTTTSAVASVLLGKDPVEMTGPGVGHSAEGLQKKIDAIKKSVAVNQPDPNDPLDVLSKVGGLDMAAMCGMFIGGALYGVPVLVDGIISGVSALTALRLCPACGCAMLASHQSQEPAAVHLLKALDLEPVITADMRLGEGTGAVASMPLLDMALAVYNDVITYADIGM